jgi:putative Holliday junction resolvase
MSDAAANFMAIDYGGARVGVALAGSVARLPRPYKTLHTGETLWDDLLRVIRDEQVGTVVVGLPRGLNGQETEQTALCRAFAAELGTRSGMPVQLQDEALTSEKAKQELRDKGVDPATADIDSLAACYILEDYLQEHQPQEPSS